MPKTISLNVTHYFIMEVSKKREIQQITSNHLFEIDFKDFMKLYKDYTKKAYSVLANNTTLSSGKLYHHSDLGRTYCKMSISEKVKAIHNKIEQNKAQYDLDRQIARISALSSRDLINMNFQLKKMF